MKRSLTRRTLLSELRVLWAFNVREFITYSRYTFNPIFDVVTEPLYVLNWLLIGMFYVGGPISRNLLTMAGTGDYISYLYLGGVLMTFARTAVDTIGNSLRVEMNRGTLESCWIAPISRFTMLTGRIIMNLIYVILANLFTAVLIHFAFQPIWHIDWPTILIIMFLALLSNYAFGILMGGIIIVFREAWAIFQIFSSILWILAGASFPIEILPPWAQSLSSIVPYYYSLRDFRAAILKGATVSELTGDMLLLLVFALVSLVLSYVLFKRMERIAKRAGTLGLY